MGDTVPILSDSAEKRAKHGKIIEESKSPRKANHLDSKSPVKEKRIDQSTCKNKRKSRKERITDSRAKHFTSNFLSSSSNNTYTQTHEHQDTINV
ncbi:unnamed protein product [Camellia sinensis]